jgi:hypothetical protein
VLKTILTIKTATRLALYSSLTLAAFACKRGADSNTDTTQVSQSAQTSSSDTSVTVRGTVQSVSTNQLVLKADTGSVTVVIAQPFHFYVRAPSDLSHVKESAFIGVTTVKQPDGSERATEIHIFPEELRGVGEGSRMMAPNANASRMTNGNVSQSRMTNGTASQSRMSNGNVSSTNGTSLVVQYAGGSQNVTVPPNTPVTELKLSSKPLAAGDQVAVLATRAPDGSLTATRAISTAR